MCGGSNIIPMAAAASKNNIKSFCGKSFKKSESLLFVALVLVASASFLVVFLSFSVTFDHGSKGSLALINRRTLVQIPSNNVNDLHQDVHQKTTTTFAAAAAATTRTRNEREFRMAAHEVPSGPNPESN